MKAENLLIDDEGYVKIIDFGFCKKLSLGQQTQTLCGTPEYLAPELLHEADYGTAVDWWALGCVMYEMMTGRLPFYSRDQSKLFTAIMNDKLSLPGSISSPAKALLSGLLSKVLLRLCFNLTFTKNVNFPTKDPAQRLGAGTGDVQEIKEHRFFQVHHTLQPWRF